MNSHSLHLGGGLRRRYLLIRHLSYCGEDDPKHRGEQLTLSGRGGGRGLGCHAGRSGGAAENKRGAQNASAAAARMKRSPY